MIEQLVTRTAPQLLEQFGIGVDTAAEILIVVGDNQHLCTEPHVVGSHHPSQEGR